MPKLLPAPLKLALRNTPQIELWPANLLRARSNHDARLLSRADCVLRRKRDGKFLAAIDADGVHPMVPNLPREPGLAAALALQKTRPLHTRNGLEHVRALPLQGLQNRLSGLGLDAQRYAEDSGLGLVAEPDWLAFSGFDRYRRPLWLHVDAARAWLRLHDAARSVGIILEAISGYRSHDYQLGIFERKLARGLSVDEILAVNAAPGFSEHHSGLALDICTLDDPPAEESFEQTAAFDWLQTNAAVFGFHMSYPRNNPHGIVYEPWHWRFSATPPTPP